MKRLVAVFGKQFGKSRLQGTRHALKLIEIPVSVRIFGALNFAIRT